MRKEHNMKMYGSSLIHGLLSLFFAVTATLLGWSVPASAQTTTATTSVAVTVKGTASAPSESVSFSGQANLVAQVGTDPNLPAAPAVVVLWVDLSGVTGVGTSSNKKYVTTDRYIVNRPLAATDLVQLSFPFYLSGGNPQAASVGMTTFNLSYNTSTLQLTAATGSIGNP